MREQVSGDTVEESATPPEPPQAYDAASARREMFLAELRRMGTAKFRLSRLFTPLLLIGKGYIVGYLGVCLLRYLCHATPITDTVWGSLFTVAFWGGFLWALVGDGLTRGSQNRLRGLIFELRGDPRTAGAIAQICYSAQFLSMAEITVTPLLYLLPRVKASDAEHFSDAQMQALIGLLATHNPHGIPLRQFEVLPLAVLKALEQIGDSHAIEPVRRLTTGKSNRRYHKAAQECLVYIEQNGGKRDYNRTLLLPVSAEGGKETLLRPTAPQAETPPELLLRAGHSEERG